MTATRFHRWQANNKVLDAAAQVAREATPDGGPGQIETELLFSPAVPTLVDLSKDADLVVVGSRGRGPFVRSVLGSVSASLIRHAHCPVAVIHDEDPLMPYPAEAPVLVGIDGSPASEQATAIAFQEASWRGVDLVALHVWSDVGVNDYPANDWPAMKPAAERILAERLAGWQERYPDVTVRRVVEDSVTIRHTNSSGTRNRRNWWSSVVMDEVDSPACYWGRSALRWRTRRGCR